MENNFPFLPDPRKSSKAHCAAGAEETAGCLSVDLLFTSLRYFTKIRDQHSVWAARAGHRPLHVSTDGRPRQTSKSSKLERCKYKNVRHEMMVISSASVKEVSKSS